ncbi:MAG: hypothetical protein Q9162_005853 [Coniocarpon cinnabarinum]
MAGCSALGPARPPKGRPRPPKAAQGLARPVHVSQTSRETTCECEVLRCILHQARCSNQGTGVLSQCMTQESAALPPPPEFAERDGREGIDMLLEQADTKIDDVVTNVKARRQ